MTDPYEALGIKPSASKATVRAAYRKAASRAHPDKNGGTADAMAAINGAYALLSDDTRRARFDATGQTEDRPPIEVVGAQLLEAIFEQLMDKGVSDLLSAARQHIQTKTASLAAGNVQHRNARDRLERYRPAVNVKRGMNLVHELVERKTKRITQQLAANDEAAVMLLAALRILDDYEFNQAPEEQGYVTAIGPSGMTSTFRWGAV